MPKRRPKRPRKSGRKAGALSTRELAATLGVTERQIRTWVKKGCPVRREASASGGRARCKFDLLAVKTWLVGAGIAPRYDKKAAVTNLPQSGGLNADQPATDAPRAPLPARADHVPADQAQALGYEGMVARLRIAETQAFGAWLRAVRGDHNPPLVAALARVYIEQAEQLRKVEKDLTAVRGSRDGWLPADQVTAAFERMAAEVRGALLDLPHTLTPLLVGRPKGKVKEALARAVHHILTRLANPAEEAPPDGN